jgi:ATP-dependent Clp protease ATP-binding subunit ClpA
MLKPALMKGDIRVIGATTGTEYDKWIRSDPALERRFQPVTVEELDATQTWEVLVARRPRLEHHHAVAVADDALKAAIVLTDQFVTDRARPDKAIDALDEACAHAQATAQVSPELDRLIRERRKLDARLRRGEEQEREPAEEQGEELEIGQVLERFGAELERLFGGRDPAPAPATAAPPPPRPKPTTIAERRAELDQRLRAELERQGIVVTGKDVARAVGAAVGKEIQWAG